MMTNFVHLHLHSYYSFFDSTLSPRQIVEFAQAQGMTHIALTDTNSFTGIMEFNLHCREAGIAPLLGVEVQQPLLIHRQMLSKRAWKFHEEDAKEFSVHDFEESGDGDNENNLKTSGSPMLWQGDRQCRAVLLARNMEGYKVISHLLTRRHLEADFDLLQEVGNLNDSVILISDCPVVLSRCRSGSDAVYGELIASPRRRRQNRQVYDYCVMQGLPLVMTADAKMLNPAEKNTHHLLRAMGTLTTLDNLAQKEKIDPHQYLMTDKEMRDIFMLDRGSLSGIEDYQKHLAEAYDNTRRIAEDCHCELPYRQWRFPTLKMEGRDPVKILEEITQEGIRERYGNCPSEEVITRTRQELDVIKKLGFTDYFLLVKQIIEEARQREFFTLGRGSAANSIVTYALDISNVCPVKYNLYFERFLNPDRSSPPDIDLDFSWRDRDQMIDWCFDFFGRDNVALISTISTLQYRQAIREVAKTYGIPPSEVDHFNKLSETGHQVKEAGGLKDYTKEEPWATILKVAKKIQGFPHHLSVHCGGLIIAPMPVVDLMPLTLSAKGYAITQMDMLGVEDLGLVKMDLLGNRSLGVLKDIINEADSNASRDYSIIPDSSGSQAGNDNERDEVFRREAVRMKLEGTRRGTSIAFSGSLNTLQGGKSESKESYLRPLKQRILDFYHVTNDPWTRALIDQGQTMGCFYIESPGMRALLERLRCENYDEIVAASSIIRPGVAESGMMKEYIDRHQKTRLQPDICSPLSLLPPANGSARMADGTLPLNAHSKTKAVKDFQRSEKTKPLTITDTMRQLLPETHGVMVYQEDVLKIAHDLAGMSFAEADILRRAISGKLRSTEHIMKIQERFLEGCKNHQGLPLHEAEEVWRQLASFAGYSFCKGHSAAFAVLSYQIAYLKAHHPAEFFAAVLTNQGGFYGAGAYISEARRWGIETLHPCVNKSSIEYHGATLCKEPTTSPLPIGDNTNRGWIRPGLRFISGLTTKNMKLILAERKQHGPFKSFYEFLHRCPLHDDEITALISCGACDGFFQESPVLSRAQALLKGKLFRDQTSLNQNSLFENTPSPSPDILQVQPFTRFEIGQMELKHLGFMISNHPLDFVEAPPNIISACDIRNHAGKTVRMIGWGIAAKILSARNNRKPMKMLTLEDKTGTYEATLFPRAYAKFAPQTLTKGPYIVTGEIDIALGSPTLNVRRIELLPTKENVLPSKVS